MAAKKKTPALAQVRKLAREKLGSGAIASCSENPFGWCGLAYNPALEDSATLRVEANYRSQVARALYAALEAL